MLYIGTYIIMLDKRGVPFVLDDHNIYSACTLSRRRLFYIYVLYDIYLPNVYLYIEQIFLCTYARVGTISLSVLYCLYSMVPAYIIYIYLRYMYAIQCI